MSWDVLLLRFRDRAVVPFNVDDARRIVLSTEGARETEPGVAEITSRGVADIYFGGESPEILFSVFANSPSVTGLIYELARELEMVVFFPNGDRWGCRSLRRNGDPRIAGSVVERLAGLRRRLCPSGALGLSQCRRP